MYYHEPNIFCVEGPNLTFRKSNFKLLYVIITFEIYRGHHRINMLLGKLSLQSKKIRTSKMKFQKAFLHSIRTSLNSA